MENTTEIITPEQKTPQQELASKIIEMFKNIKPVDSPENQENKEPKLNNPDPENLLTLEEFMKKIIDVEQWDDKNSAKKGSNQKTTNPDTDEIDWHAKHLIVMNAAKESPHQHYTNIILHEITNTQRAPGEEIKSEPVMNFQYLPEADNIPATVKMHFFKRKINNVSTNGFNRIYKPT